MRDATVHPPVNDGSKVGLKMIEVMKSLIESGAWKALEAHAATNRTLQLKDLFAQDPKRGERLTVEAAGIYFDYPGRHLADRLLRPVGTRTREGPSPANHPRNRVRNRDQAHAR